VLRNYYNSKRGAGDGGGEDPVTIETAHPRSLLGVCAEMARLLRRYCSEVFEYTAATTPSPPPPLAHLVLLLRRYRNGAFPGGLAGIPRHLSPSWGGGGGRGGGGVREGERERERERERGNGAR